LTFVAHVQNVYDPIDALGGSVLVDDLVHGVLTYDTAAADTDPGTAVGRYEYRGGPNGLSVTIGSLTFQTDPDDVDLSVTIRNDDGTPPRDQHLVQSRRNLPLSNGATVSLISWQLDDDRHAAVDGTALSVAPPDLARWRSEFGLTLEGGDTVSYIIRAHVLEVRRTD
jgi:hypothetical protein